MLKDLTPVALLPSVPYWMTVRRSMPANNLQELVAWLKSNKASASTTGTASLARFCGMDFQKATGTSFQFVPYRGGAPALQDLVAGNIDLNCDLAANSLAQYRNGNIKALAVMAKRDGSRRRKFRPPTRRACRESTSAPGTASGRRRTRHRMSSRGSTTQRMPR